MKQHLNVFYKDRKFEIETFRKSKLGELVDNPKLCDLFNNNEIEIGGVWRFSLGINEVMKKHQ